MYILHFFQILQNHNRKFTNISHLTKAVKNVNKKKSLNKFVYHSQVINYKIKPTDFQGSLL